MKKSVKMFVVFVMSLAVAVGMVPADVIVAEADNEIITSEELYVRGYQIRAGYNDDGTPNVGFRAIAYAPLAGSEIVVDGKRYTVARTGILFVLDDDCSGYSDRRVLDDKYTILDVDSYQNDGVSEYYTGVNAYDGVNLTFGYLSTPLGYENNVNTSSTGNIYYARTLTDMENLVANTMHIRAFVTTTDGTIIYSEKTWYASVMGVAYDLYVNGRMSSEEGHKYLYDNILHGELAERLHDEKSDYRYYLSGEVEYGWSGLVKPGF